MKNKLIEKWSGKDCEEWAGEIGLSKNTKKILKKFTGSDLISIYNECGGDIEKMNEYFNGEIKPFGELKKFQFQLERIRDNLMTYSENFAKYEKLREEKKKKKKSGGFFSTKSTASVLGGGFIDDPFMFTRENILQQTPEEVGNLMTMLWKASLAKNKTSVTQQQIDSVTNDLKQCMIKMEIDGEVFLEMQTAGDWTFCFQKELVRYLDQVELFSYIVYDYLPQKKE
ncbi:hypothetical protein FDP41_009354 [Naegleria fowleri]|uniref:Uncharacterized protein n=1 Tax=Naegleria fowleri TaxID=5763 RepID=A0A6A5BCR8_NAEFO|nr:uncharacterized protein FDP41_009354 [Naegleria fowleri]KAF0972451.1 hypothetical protein FDP41_009354 [Naegleria fowleri]CAG4719365.1 unnamed protein product [Naegleria fowleri]